MNETKEQRERRPPRVIHWILVSMWPTLALYAENVGEVDVWPVCLVLFVSMLVGTALFLLFWAITRDTGKAGLVVTCFFGFFFCYSGLRFLVTALVWLKIAGNGEFAPHWLLLPIWCVALLAVWGFIVFTRLDLQSPTRVLNILAVILVLFSFIPISIAHWNAHRPLPKYREDALLQQKWPARSSLPDIWFIIPDRYASADTLRSAYGFDNQEFFEQLRERGFYVAEESRCNYANTVVSLTSTLNLDYHPESVMMSTLDTQLRQGHRVGGVLRLKGYQYYHVGVQFYPVIINELATWSLWRDEDSMSGLKFMRAMLSMTPLQMREEFHPDKLDFDLSVLGYRDKHEVTIADLPEIVDKISDSSGPRFVLCLGPSPHPPFTFSSDGTRLKEYPPDGSKKAYIEKLQFCNTLLLKMVDKIVANSEQPPIIIIQADEGPYLRGDDVKKDLLEMRKTRTGIISAFYVPESAKARLYPQISPVNTFRLIFGEALGLDIDLLDDRVYIWPGGGSGNDFAPSSSVEVYENSPEFGGSSSVAELKFVDVTDETRAETDDESE